ncbi:MAG: hypothetical protein ACRDKT_15525 [Actinomycetota bacterium]
MESTEYILVTGSEEEVPALLERSLGAALAVKRCPGPSAAKYCPALHHQTCELRRDAKAAVVYLAGEHEFHTPGRWECLMAGTSPGVAVLAGLTHIKRSGPTFAIVGARSGPLGVLQALAGMFDAPELDLDWD